jgi:hypothetical protein
MALLREKAERLRNSSRPQRSSNGSLTEILQNDEASITKMTAAFQKDDIALITCAFQDTLRVEKLPIRGKALFF